MSTFLSTKKLRESMVEFIKANKVQQIISSVGLPLIQKFKKATHCSSHEKLKEAVEEYFTGLPIYFF